MRATLDGAAGSSPWAQTCLSLLRGDHLMAADREAIRRLLTETKMMGALVLRALKEAGMA